MVGLLSFRKVSSANQPPPHTPCQEKAGKMLQLPNVTPQREPPRCVHADWAEPPPGGDALEAVVRPSASSCLLLAPLRSSSAASAAVAPFRCGLDEPFGSVCPSRCPR